MENYPFCLTFPSRIGTHACLSRIRLDRKCPPFSTHNPCSSHLHHSLMINLELTRSPIITTLLQVSSRILLVWGITYPFPFTAQSPFYSTMLLAWSTTEVIRYTYYLALSTPLSSPNRRGEENALMKRLTWLRYAMVLSFFPSVQFSIVSFASFKRLPWVLYSVKGNLNGV